MKKLYGSASRLIRGAIILFAVIASAAKQSHAQVPNWAWAKSAGGTSDDWGNSVSTDAGGNVFVTGFFGSNTITFGTTTLTNAGGSDIFIVKYDGSGNVLWAKSAGGTSFDHGSSCSTDGSGNVFVTGYFGSASITFGTTTLTNANVGTWWDMFIVKYDPSGNVLWANSAGGEWDDYGNSCSTDGSGNVFVTGFFASDSITFGTTTLTTANVGTWDMFIVKYDPSGNVLWANSAGGEWDDYGNSCSTDGSGNVFVTGFFASDSITFGTTTLTNAGNTGTGSTFDIFIVKYDSSGNVLWASSAGGTSFEEGHSCSTDGSGNVFVTGNFYGPSITLGTTTLTNANAGYSDMLIVKYDPTGTVLWAKSAGGIGDDPGLSCSTDGSGNVLVTGYFEGSITFGTTTLTNAGIFDIFIVKYDPSGNVLWAQRAGGTADDYGNSCSTDGNGNVFVTGHFVSPAITFGTIVLTNAQSAGVSSDVFIAKLSGVTGIDEFQVSGLGFEVYPNPSLGMFNVQCLMANGNTLTINHQPSTIAIYNVLGEKVHSWNSGFVDSGDTNPPIYQSTIDLSTEPNGIYFLHISTEQGRAVKKIIINK